MKKILIHPLVLCACLLPFTGGCAAADAIRSVRTTVAAGSMEADLQRYASRLRAMSAAELSAESETLQKNFNARRNEDARLRLALFHVLAPAPHGDRLRALALFDVPADGSNGRGRNHPLAQLFLPSLQDYRRLDDSLAASQLKLREEQKRSEALQQSNEQMRQKLDALRDIEVKILDRPSTK